MVERVGGSLNAELRKIAYGRGDRGVTRSCGNYSSCNSDCLFILKINA